VHIANVGRDNLGDIVRLARECPTRPLFLFLFAQIAEGIQEHLASEMAGLDRHPELRLLGMDEFFLTLQDAIARGLVRDPLYQPTPALEETWLRAPGRHRLPYCHRLAAELARIVRLQAPERRRLLAEPAWIELVSREIEHVARNREAFLTHFGGRAPIPADQEADTLLYVAFTVAWTTVRAALEAQGLYANHRTQCLRDFARTCGDFVNLEPFQGLFAAWEEWESGAPALEQLAAWCEQVAQAAQALLDRLGPAEGAEFTAWPPPTI